MPMLKDICPECGAAPYAAHSSDCPLLQKWRESSPIFEASVTVEKKELDQCAYKLAQEIHHASDGVSEERMRQHGGIITEYTSLSKLWSTLLGFEIKPELCIVMMAVHKANRIFCGAVDHKDHYLDGSNYFALAWGVHETLKEEEK